MDATLVFGIADSFKKSFKAARHDAGLDEVHFHDLRHTAATRLAEAKLNPAFISEILGHRNSQTTARYVNKTNAVNDEAREVLEGRK